MPNDPRVKFRSGKVCDKDIDYLRKHPEYLRDHPECRVVFAQHYSGGGSSGRLRSIFEDGTPPPDRPTEQPGGGETGGGSATDIVPASLPVKPGLDPGGIAGITIASAIAMGAALGLAEHERRRRLNRGLPLTQDNVEMANTRSRPNLNRGGTRVPSSSSGSGGASARGGIVPNDSPSISRSTSSSSTPSNYESASSRPSAPAAAAPTPAAAPAPAIQGIRDAINTPGPAPKLPPPPANRPSSTRQRPTATNIRTSAPGTQTPAPIGSLTPYFDAPQIEMPNLRPPAPAAPAPAAVLDDIRAAMQTNLPIPAPAPEIQGIRDAMGTRVPSPPRISEPPSPRPGPSESASGVNRNEEMISMFKEIEAFYKLELAKPPPRTQEGLAERRRLRQKLKEVQSKLDYARSYEQRNLINESIDRGISTGKITSNRIPRDINPPPPVGNTPTNDGFNAARQTGVELQDLTPQAHAQQTQAEAEAMLADIDTMTRTSDPAAIAEQNRITTPSGSQTPSQLLDIEIQQELKKARASRARMFEEAMAGVNERIQRGKASLADLQKMGTRKKILLTGDKTPESGLATLERARAAGRPMPPAVIETEMRGSSLSARAAASGAAKPEIQGIRDAINTPGPAPKLPPPPLSDAEALEQGIKQSTIEAGLGYTSVGGETSKGVTAEMLRAEKPSNRPFQPQEPVQGPRSRQGKQTVSNEPLPRDWVAPRAKAPVERIVLGAPPPPAPAPAERPRAPPPAPAPLERPAPLVEEIAPEIQDFLKLYNKVIEVHTAAGRVIPEVPEKYINTLPEGEIELRTRGYIINKILKESPDLVITGETGTEFEGNKITPEELRQELLDRFKEAKAAAKFDEANIDSKIASQEGFHTAETQKVIDKRRKLTKKTGLLATEEQRLRPTPLAGEAQARVQARQAAAPAEARAAAAPEARAAAAAPEARAAAPEARAMSAVAAPEVAARRRMGVPELTAPTIPPTETASFAERRAFFEETSRVKPPIGEPAPSAPPSAPESGAATPSERPTMEQTPAERAAFAEELTGRLSTKKGPARQKAKINIGKPKTTANPLDIFVSPQHRNLPNTELNPGAKGFKGALTEISSRVPRLVPTRSTLISMGAEGGSMVGGFAAGYFSAQAMNDYFAKHPAKNLGEQYGQALATTFVGMAVGSITQVVLSQVIRQGVNYALAGEMAAMEGAISGGGTLFLSSIGEAALFTLVGVTTQMATTKFLEDAGFNHAVSRSAGALASTFALAGTEVGLWLAKGGPVNPAGDVSFLASEAMIIGFGIYSFVTEFFEGAKQDEEEEEYQAQLAENQRLNEERQRTIDNTNRRNMARTAFMIAYEAADYDFDKALANLTPEQRIDLGQNAEATDPNGLTAFRAQVEAAFDPLLDTSLPEGYTNPAPLSREDQLKRDTYTAYVNWYVDSVNGKNPPPFDFNSEGAKLLNDESGGTWTSAANVHATTSITMAHRTNPLIEKAQREIVDAFHKDHKTIEEMPYDIVKYADLDPSFRERYNLYIISEAQSYIYQQYNNASIRYDSMDPRLVAIANRDPEFRGAVDTYYQVLANQARDYNMTIQDAARLNAMAIPDQQVEIGKLNEARNRIIQQHQAENQEQVDRYNASIIQEISAYGDNFEAIIRNINDQALLTGHTFLYAATPADLYRQLHMEMPEIELVDPDTDTGEGGTDAPLPGPSKGRKIGDTDLYGYRYKLTDEQNQELDEQARIGVFADNETQMAAAAAIIYERDRYLFEDTDAEKAAKENLTLDEYYNKYGIVAEQPIIEWNLSKGIPKEDGKYRFPDGTIETWRNGFRVKVDTTNKVAPPAITKYDPTLSSQPDGQIEMPNGAVRTYKDGLVTSVKYPSGTTAAEMLTPDEINAKERPTITPTTPTEPTEPTEPPVTPVEPVVDPNRQPTYEELKVMYPDKYTLFSSTYKSMHSQASQETVDKQTELYLRQQYGKNPLPLPPPQPVTPTEPKQQVLFSGDRKMPDGSTRVYSNGKIVGISYPPGFPANQMQKLDKQSLANLNKQEGLYYVEVEPTPVTPTQPTDPTTLKQGSVTMPDGSRRTYKNGLVIEVYYPPNMADLGNKNPAQINDAEGVRGFDWTPQANVTPVEPVVDRNTLKQGRVTMPDGSTRTYIDGKVVSVQYPDGKTGPNINQINASEGVQTGTREPTYAELQIMYKEDYEYKQRFVPDSALEAQLRELYKTEPVPIPGTVAPVAPAAAPMAPAAPAPAANTTAQALNLAVAPARAPATTSMPEDTTPGVANP